MTDDAKVIAEIQARLDAATPGPWAFESCGEKGDGSYVVGTMFHPDDEDAATPLLGLQEEIYDEKTQEFRDYYRDEEIAEIEHQTRNHYANANLIAHAPSDIATLLRLLQSRASTREEALEEALSEMHIVEMPAVCAVTREFREGFNQAKIMCIAALAAIKSSPAPSPITKTEG